MEEITVDKTELYNLVKLAVRDVFEEELFRLRLEALAFVSDEEMEEIEDTYDTPQQIRKNVARSERLDI